MDNLSLADYIEEGNQPEFPKPLEKDATPFGSYCNNVVPNKSEQNAINLNYFFYPFSVSFLLLSAILLV